MYFECIQLFLTLIKSENVKMAYLPMVKNIFPYSKLVEPCQKNFEQADGL